MGQFYFGALCARWVRIKPALTLALRLAGKQSDSERLCLFQFRRQLRQHQNAATDMKTAHDNFDSNGKELTGQVKRTRELVGLHSYKTDETLVAVTSKSSDNPRHRYNRCRFVERFDLDFYRIA